MNPKYHANLELSIKLKELGVKQESEWYWENTVKQEDKKAWKIVPKKDCQFYDPMLEYYSAFHVGELGEGLPPDTPSEKTEKGASCWMSCSEDGDTYWDEKLGEEGNKTYDYKYIQADTEANARAKMRIYLLENKLMESNPKSK